LVRADLHLAANVRGDLAAQVTLDLVVRLDVVTECDELVVVQLVNAGVGVDAGSGEGLDRTSATDTENVRESDHHALFARQIHSDEACHVLAVPFGSAEVSSPGASRSPRSSSGL